MKYKYTLISKRSNTNIEPIFFETILKTKSM